MRDTWRPCARSWLLPEAACYSCTLHIEPYGHMLHYLAYRRTTQEVEILMPIRVMNVDGLSFVPADRHMIDGTLIPPTVIVEP